MDVFSKYDKLDYAYVVKYRKEMKGIDWKKLYNIYCTNCKYM